MKMYFFSFFISLSIFNGLSLNAMQAQGQNQQHTCFSACALNDNSWLHSICIPIIAIKNLLKECYDRSCTCCIKCCGEDETSSTAEIMTSK